MGKPDEFEIASIWNSWKVNGHRLKGLRRPRVAVSKRQVRGAVKRILASEEWLHAERLARLLTFMVEHKLSGKGDELNEALIGWKVFGRPEGYDLKSDNVARVETRRLRAKLEEYYTGSGVSDPVLIKLEKASFEPQFSGGVPFQLSLPSIKVPWRGVGIAAGLTALITLVFYLPKPSFSRTRSQDAPRMFTNKEGNSRSPAFSPDGSKIVYSRDSDGIHSALFVQSIDEPFGRPLTFGNVRDTDPAWSPDGNKVAFLRHLRGGGFAVIVKDASNTAKPEQKITEVAVRSPLDWTSDGSSLVASDRGEPGFPPSIVQIQVPYGVKQRLTEPPANSDGDSEPRISPDGKWLAFVRTLDSTHEDVYWMPVSGGAPRRLTQEDRRLSGFCWTPDSASIVASLERGAAGRSLWRWQTSGGQPVRVAESAASPTYPSMPKRASGLAFVVRMADTNLWGLNPSSGAPARALTQSAQMDSAPSLSPDGKRLLWRSASAGANEIWMANRDGSAARQVTRMNGPITGSPQWAPDSSQIVFESRPNGNSDIFIMPSAGGAPKPMTSSPASEVLPSFSRDNKSLYYSTDAKGSWQLMKLNLDTRVATPIAGNGAFAAVESADGQWVYFTRQGQELGGIFRMPSSGGREELLVGELSSRFWGQWAISAKAIFYAVFPNSGTQAIRRLDLATGVITDVASLARSPAPLDSGMTVALDESWLVWSQLDQSGHDVYVVEGYR